MYLIIFKSSLKDFFVDKTYYKVDKVLSDNF